MNPTLNILKIAGFNLRFESEIKDVKVWVLDKQYNILGVFSNALKLLNFVLQILHMCRYLKSGKL
jgi:hypothetical protein